MTATALRLIESDWSRDRAVRIITQRLKAVGRHLAAVRRLGGADHKRLVRPYAAFLEDLQKAIDALQAASFDSPAAEALALELEALTLWAPSRGLPAIATIGLHRVGFTGWTISYVALSYQLQRRAGVLVEAAAAFEVRFNAFSAAAGVELELTPYRDLADSLAG